MVQTESSPNAEMIVERDVRVPMRDGIHIALDIYRPAGDGPHPTLYAVSPYQKRQVSLPSLPVFRFRETGPIDWWVSQGYAYAVADVRGTGASEGEFRLLSEPEQHDLYDTIEWLAAQPWSNGKVGMVGESFYGQIQWLAAAQQPPHLACIAPYDAFVDVYRDVLYHGGIYSQGFFTFWTFDTRARELLCEPGPHGDGQSYDIIYHTLLHPTDGPFHEERSAYPKFDRIKTPFYSIGNWTNNNLHLRGNLLAFELIDAPKKLLVNGPRDEHDADPDQRIFDSPEMVAELKRWYDHWLLGIDTGIMDEPPVKILVHNTGVRSEREWPLARAVYTPLYLRRGPSGEIDSLNDGALSWEPPAAGEPPTSYSYPQPEWTIPGLGSAVLGKRGLPNQVKKILTFLSPSLKEDLEVTGPIVLRLWASSDQTDTDFMVRITDQHHMLPGERAVLEKALDVAPPGYVVTRGWLKASHRALDPRRSTAYRPFHTHTDPQPLTPGEIYQFEIEVWPTSYLFKKGHRIRLELASADSPVIDHFNHFYGIKVGTDTIYHDAEHPSQLLLPVVRG